MAKKPKSGAKKKPTRKSAAARAVMAAGAPSVTVVNMVPVALSDETNQDSEPMLAVNPANPDEMVGTAFTPDPMGGVNAPVYVSADGGNTWVLNSIVPGGGPLGTGDITVAFSGSTNTLYGGILRGDTDDSSPPVLNLLRTPTFAGPTTMAILLNRANSDQPFTQATTVASGPSSGKDRVYVGDNNTGAAPQTATIELSLDAATAANGNFVPPSPIALERRTTSSQDGPQIRPAIHADGTVYAAYYGWRAQSGNFRANTFRVDSADVVVVRDDSWGSGPSPFTALIDSGDGVLGLRVVQGISFAFNRNGIPANGQQRLGGTLSLAVDPNHSGTVYLAWGDDQTTTGFTLHVRSSLDRGATWTSNDLLTVDHATNAALAINSDSVVGLLYQQLTGSGSTMRWVTHFRSTTDSGVSWKDLILADTPANSPAAAFDPYLGDYDHLLALGKTFYGVFSANNTPDPANFPSGVTYQRNHDFTARKLLPVSGTTPVAVSIDPFFFKIVV
jgi:hypothetical protein